MASILSQLRPCLLCPPQCEAQVRCFVAINLSPEAKQAITRRQIQIRSLLPDSVRDNRALRWVEPELTHLTLLFLGEVSSAELVDVGSALHNACEGVGRLSLCLGDLGFFPSAQRPRVLWIGMAGDIAALQELQAQVASSLRPFISKPEEKAFHPHLTLARIRSESKVLGRHLRQAVSSTPVEEGARWEVLSIELMRSQLMPSGPEYFIEQSIPLDHK